MPLMSPMPPAEGQYRVAAQCRAVGRKEERKQLTYVGEAGRPAWDRVLLLLSPSIYSLVV